MDERERYTAGMQVSRAGRYTRGVPGFITRYAWAEPLGVFL